MGISWDNGNKSGEFECMMRSYVILIANDSDSMANDSDYIYRDLYIYIYIMVNNGYFMGVSLSLSHI